VDKRSVLSNNRPCIVLVFSNQGQANNCLDIISLGIEFNSDCILTQYNELVLLYASF